MARIGLDLDGVFYDFEQAIRQYLAEQGTMYSQMPPATQWHFYRDWGLSLEEFTAAGNNAADEGALWHRHPCRLEDLKPLERLRAAGHTLHIVTARDYGTEPAVSHEATVRWLRLSGFPYDTLTFASDKTIVKTDYFLEDKVANHDALIDANVKSCLIDRAYNQDADNPRDGMWADVPRTRVASVADFVEAVENAESLRTLWYGFAPWAGAA
jgi:hypothetical protein